MNISCAFPQHQSPPRGGKAITSQSYGFFPFAVFFLISLSFATAEKKSQARGEKLKSNFLTPQQTEFGGWFAWAGETAGFTLKSCNFYADQRKLCENSLFGSEGKLFPSPTEPSPSTLTSG